MNGEPQSIAHIVDAQSSKRRPSNTNPVFDGIIRAIAQCCNTPIAFISWIDGAVEKASSQVGLEPVQWPGDRGFTNAAKSDAGELLQICDVRDGRGEHSGLSAIIPSIRFFATLPILDSLGRVSGAVSIVDVYSRNLTHEQSESFIRLGKLINNIVGLAAAPPSFSLFESLESSLSSAIAVSDPNIDDQPIIYCNTSFCKLTGYRSAEILGRNCRFLHGPGTDQDAVEGLQTDLLLGAARTTTLKNFRRDGTAFWNELTVTIDRGINGHIRQFIWMARDVTEKHEAQQRASEMGSLFEKIQIPLYAIDTQTNRFVLANQIGLRALGYTESELLKLGPPDTIPTLTLESWTELTRPILENKVSSIVRATVHKRRDGSTYPVETKLQCGVVDGKDVIVALSTDISPRHAMQDLIDLNTEIESPLRRDRMNRLRVARRRLNLSLLQAQAANLEKSKFLAAASHDLRQPLQSIEMNLSGLEDTVEAGDASQMIRSIRTSVAGMNDLLNGLLDLSRFDAGVTETHRHCFPISQTLNRVVGNNLRQAHQKGLELAVIDCDAIVFSDPVLLERIVDNFVGNAIRFTSKGKVSIQAYAEGKFLRICVKDTGIGIPVHLLSRIFDEYFQLDNRFTNQTKGLGLGLSIVSRISQLLGHSIHVTSELNSGSCFSVDVPVGEANRNAYTQSATTHTHAAVPTNHSSGHLLYVEDNLDIAAATTRLLSRSGYDVCSVSNAQQALEKIGAGFKPDLILSDYHLSGNSGIDTIKQVRSTTARPIPAIILTGDTSASGLAKKVHDNCQILQKPIQFKALAAQIDRLLERN